MNMSNNLVPIAIGAVAVVLVLGLVLLTGLWSGLPSALD